MKLAGTQYHAPDEAAVQATLRTFGFLTAPIRPSPHVLREFGRYIAATSDSAVLIFGATPELIDIANELGVPRIVSMDWNVDNFEAMRRLALGDKLVTEGAGAAAVAAALATPVEERGLSVAVVSGGSVDHDLFGRVVSGKT